MIQNLITYSIIAASSSYVIFNLVQMVLPSKKRKQVGCAGCSGCQVKSKFVVAEAKLKPVRV